MSRLVISRLLQSLVVVALIAVGSFFILRLAPGDPARSRLGITADPEAVAALRSRLGLDDPIYQQLGRFITDAMHGNLGTSYTTQQPVITIISERFGPTAQVALFAFIIAVVVGLPLGILSAVRRGGLTDTGVQVASMVGVSIPNFVVGLFMLLVFGLWFPGILPFRGYVSMLTDPVQGFRHTILPAAALSLAPIAILARMTRASMLEVLGQDYILTAKAFGVSWRETIWRDALRNALLPVLTVMGLLVGFLLSGTVVMEQVFGIPGLGSELVQSFDGRDYPVAIGIMLVFAVGFLGINLLTDVAYTAINPRLRANPSGRASL